VPNKTTPPKKKDGKLQKTLIVLLNTNMLPKWNDVKIAALSPSSILTAETTTTTSLSAPSMSKQLSPSFSTPTKTKSPSSMSSDVMKKLKFSPDVKNVAKKPAFLINFCNRDHVEIKCLKYLKHFVDLPINQKGQLTFLLNQFQAKEIQASFYQMIGKVGGVATSAFLPMAMRKTKLINENLCLVYDHKSMMINTDKNTYR
jgi:hypothetical protein